MNKSTEHTNIIKDKENTMNMRDAYVILTMYGNTYGGSHFKSKPKKSHSAPFTFSGLPAQAFDPPSRARLAAQAFEEIVARCLDLAP